MPKTTKRAATKRAARIARAHATDLPKLQVKAPPSRSTKGKRPSGLGRYPWLVGIILVLLATTAGLSYVYHVGPFAPQPVKKVVAKVVPTATPAVFNKTSPCNASTIVKQLTNTAAAPTTAQFNKNQHSYSKVPATTIDQSKVYCVGLNTSRGLVVLELDPKEAPNTVNNFVFLAQNHFYDGMKFYRVEPNSVIQTGSPAGSTAAGASGGPGYSFKDEPVKGTYTQGCVAMANSGANTNGSQFFVCTADDTKLGWGTKYNLFGHVTAGMNILLKIQGPNSANPKVTPDTLNYVIAVAVKP
ncbi:MAG TPA: peptidylprolyl isomerase [Ktedonobacteraceae bacterium]